MATIASRTGSRTSDRTLLLLEIAGIVVLATILALQVAPEPFSDWRYYWEAAGDPARYERGGAVLVLLGWLKRLGASPHVTMLGLNLAAAGATLMLARRADPAPGKWMAHLVALYLLLLAPYYGIVQLDLLASASLGLGLVLILHPPARPGRYGSAAVAILAVAAAVSTRPQFLLVLTALGGLLVLVWWVGRKLRSNALLLAAGLLFAGALAGFGFDSALRAQAERSGAIRTNSSVTLYSGLLASSTRPADCGRWSPGATATMRSDLGKPLGRAVMERLQKQPVSHWAAVMACKVPQIVAPPPFAWAWLMESPSSGERPQAGTVRAVAVAEQLVYRLLTGVFYVLALLVAWRQRSSGHLRWLPMLWLLAFGLVHLVFEVQGRYFLAMLLLLPVLCALVTRGRERATGASGRSDRITGLPPHVENP
jgi:hypothetical protein